MVYNKSLTVGLSGLHGLLKAKSLANWRCRGRRLCCGRRQPSQAADWSKDDTLTPTDGLWPTLLPWWNDPRMAVG